MNLDVDVSLHTLIISAAIGSAALIVKAAAWALIEAMKAFLGHLVEATAKVEVLDAKLTHTVGLLGDVDEIHLKLGHHDDQIARHEYRLGKLERFNIQRA